MSGCHFTPDEVREREREHEARERQQGERAGVDRPVGLGVRPVRGEHAERDGHDQRDELRVEHQLERHRQRGRRACRSPACSTGSPCRGRPARGSRARSRTARRTARRARCPRGTAAFCSGVPNGSTASATSPGNSRSRLNANSVDRTTTTTSWSSRRPIIPMRARSSPCGAGLLRNRETEQGLASVDEQRLPAPVGERRPGEALHVLLRGRRTQSE